jgi:arylsulfatase A-like enzyme
MSPADLLARLRALHADVDLVLETLRAEGTSDDDIALAAIGAHGSLAAAETELRHVFGAIVGERLLAQASPPKGGRA